MCLTPHFVCVPFLGNYPSRLAIREEDVKCKNHYFLKFIIILILPVLRATCWHKAVILQYWRIMRTDRRSGNTQGVELQYRLRVFCSRLSPSTEAEKCPSRLPYLPRECPASETSALRNPTRVRAHASERALCTQKKEVGLTCFSAVVGGGVASPVDCVSP